MFYCINCTVLIDKLECRCAPHMRKTVLLRNEVLSRQTRRVQQVACFCLPALLSRIFFRVVDIGRQLASRKERRCPYDTLRCLDTFPSTTVSCCTPPNHFVLRSFAMLYSAVRARAKNMEQSPTSCGRRRPRSRFNQK